MKFGGAIELMQEGIGVRLPEWEGYWFKRDGCLWVHTESGDEFKQSDMSWINATIWRDDWESV